jgi:aryl-alcohol dehydrogenase-like predicted oxidoreductase
METRKIGSLDVSVVGLGCNNFGMRIDADATTAVVSAALDAGITLFDTADTYGGTRSEELLGKALGKHRGEVVIATKFGAPIDEERKGGARPEYVVSALEDSLRRLGTDYVDLYQLHFPDQETPIEDTLGALNDQVDKGKVREIGCSNFSSEMLEGAAELATKQGWKPFASVQNEYNLLNRRPERRVLGACERHHVGFLPYFPLASGLLSGKYKRGEGAPPGTRLASVPAERADQAFSDRNFDIVERLEAFASTRDHTILDLAFAWLLSRPVVASVIAGATKPEQVKANAAAGQWGLTPEEVEEIDDVASPA